MRFSEVFEAAINGSKFKLKIWTDDVFISAQFPDEHSKMSHPYLYVTSRFGKVPWLPNQVELFSKEWVIVK